MTDEPARWWQTGALYQIYPRSFADSNGDGVGDLRGIAGRLDYVQDLGMSAIWLSPIFPSPMADFGYDVSDYCGVDPLFGTMDDLDALVADAHRRGASGPPRPRPEPQLRRAPLVLRRSILTPERPPGLVPVAGRTAWGRGSEQLGEPVRRPRVGVG